VNDSIARQPPIPARRFFLAEVNAFFSRRRTELCLAAFLGVSYAYFYQGGGWNQNTRFALVRAIAVQGTLRIDNTAHFDGHLVTGDLARHDGHLYSDKAPGLALAALLPFVIAEPMVGDPNSRGGIAALSYAATLGAAGLPTVVSALLVFWLAGSLGCTRRAAAFAAAAFGVATPAWCYATLFYGHALASACLIASFAAAVSLRRAGTARRDRFLALATGTAGGWATITEYPAAVPAVIVALLAIAQVWPDGWARRRRTALGVSAGAFTCVTILALYNAAAFGAPWSLGYAEEVGFEGMEQGFLGVTYPKPDILWELLFGRYRGLLYFAPILALSPAGLMLLIREPTSRYPAIAAAAIVSFYLLFNAAYFYWDGGWSYGPRHMAPALAFLGLALAPLWSTTPPIVRAGLAATGLYSAARQLVAVATTAQPPDAFHRPFSELLWPSFAEGRLAINMQAFVDFQPAEERDLIAHAWNLGEKLGLSGHASLLPLFGLWAAIGLSWWMLRGKPQVGEGEPGSSSHDPDAAALRSLRDSAVT
jgi:hypothetical protein